MVLVSSQMPSDLKKSLVESFIGAFDGNSPLVHINTAEEAPRSFQAVHFSIYNRYAVQASIALYTSSFTNATYLGERSPS